MRAGACDDHHRSTFRHAVAGRGLPPVEPGMPTPAGNGMNRRAFMLRSAGLGLAVYGAGGLLSSAALQDGVAQAAAGGPQPVVVSVFLDGGVDHLSLLAPVDDAAYRRLRPQLGLAPSDARFTEDQRLVWHPGARSLATLHAEGKLTVIPAIGYTDADQSHFTSRHYYEVGATDVKLQSGWLGRWLDVVGAPDNPLQGLGFDGSLSPVLASTRVPVAAVSPGDDYALWARGVWGKVDDQMQSFVRRIGSAHRGSRDGALRETAAAAANVVAIGARLGPLAPTAEKPFVPPVAYPGEAKEGLSARLADVARLLGAGLPIRVAAMRAEGQFDTHEDQVATFEKDLALAADALLAFQRDLELRGLADRVVTLVWTEFGRRPEENGSKGCDHGAGGVGFVMGSLVAGKMIGEYPGLDTLDDDGNMRATTDYRAVYCALLEQWLGTDAARVIPGAGTFARPRLIA